jgi:hypothetical protein
VTNPVTVGTFGGGTNTNQVNGEYFPYLDNSQNVFDALADWYPPAQPNDLWEIKLDALDAASNPLGEVCYRVQLDNTPPVCDIHIDNGGDCKKFADDSVISGHVYAVDPQSYPGSYWLWVEPANLPGGAAASLARRAARVQGGAARAWAGFAWPGLGAGHGGTRTIAWTTLPPECLGR